MKQQKKNKLKIGIDINEVLRARWLQFDKFYVEEFGEDGVPEKEPYVYDFFKGYKWEDKIEETKYLKEDLPDDINPLDYQVDEKTGEAPVDHLAFKKEKEKLTAKEIYNRFMYEDYVFEIHGSAPIMYKQMDLHVEKFYLKYCNHVDFVLKSKENWFSVPPTLFFLSRIFSRFKKYHFVSSNEEMWDDIDILITTDPEIINGKVPEGKKIIKLERPYNKDLMKGEIDDKILQINDLNGNKNFEKIINYKQKKEKDE
jgi:hypothetical protein